MSLAQTLVFPPVERGTATEPPPTATASGSCSQGEMYDEFMADQERARAAEEATRARAAAAKKVCRSAKKIVLGTDSSTVYAQLSGMWVQRRHQSCGPSDR